MSTIYDTDPNTHTIAAAWASSPLGEPARGFADDFDTTAPHDAETAADEPQPIAKRALLAAALACGIGAGAALGVMLFEYTDSAQPTVVIPGSGAGPAAPEAPGVPPGRRLPGAPRAVPTEVLPAPDNAPGPNPVVSAPDSGQGPADVGSPPVSAPGDTTVIVDIPLVPIPGLNPQPEPPKPDEPDPEPPKPQPPDLQPGKFQAPQLPPLPPKPEPPTFLPQLPLKPELPEPPSPKLNPQPEPPSVPHVIAPVLTGP